MRDNYVKSRIRAGRPVIGTSISIPEPFVAELVGAAGFDFVLVDAEHAPIGIHQLQTMLIALAGARSTRIVRVVDNDPALIKQVLDVGAEGILVPDVASREECERAVKAARYFPEGFRGFGPRRAARLEGTRPDYIRRANEQILVLAMIEHRDAVEAIEDILATPGLDGIMVGPADLAVSLGHLNDLSNPEVGSYIDRIFEACQEVGVPFGIYSVTVPKTREWLDRGAAITIIGSDVSLLDAGVSQARRDAATLLGETTSSA